MVVSRRDQKAGARSHGVGVGIPTHRGFRHEVRRMTGSAIRRYGAALNDIAVTDCFWLGLAGSGQRVRRASSKGLSGWRTDRKEKGHE